MNRIFQISALILILISTVNGQLAAQQDESPKVKGPQIKGCAAIKEQPFHDDATAKVVGYVTLTDDGWSTVKIDTGGGKFTMDRKKLVGQIEALTAIPLNITNESEVGQLRSSLKKYQDFSIRFPKGAPLLKNQITALNGYIQRYGGGEVRVSGEWMDRERMLENQRIEAQRMAENKRIENLRIAETKRKEAEQRVIDEAIAKRKEALAKSQREKGLEEYQGQWLPIDEARSLIARDKAERARKEQAIRDEGDRYIAAVERQEEVARQIAAANAVNAAALANSQRAVLKVIQAQEGGVLCKIALFQQGTASKTSKDAFGRRVETPYKYEYLGQFSENSVFVTGISGAVDGQMLSTNVINSGENFVYTTVMGARATILKLKAIGEVTDYKEPIYSTPTWSPGPRVSSLQSVGGGG